MVTSIGLPLLIVNGKFQSLGSMTVEDLETFIPFLVKCSINRAGAQLINGIPEWWSSVIKYKFPLQKPSGLSEIGYRRHLASIVCRCYWYHDAQYLLPFCAEIANSPESVFLQSNEDNTTSIFYVHNTLQILKFNNENKNYDNNAPKFENNGKSNRMCLLPSLPKSIAIPDIYLCENCDAEFSSHTEMQKHEKVCYEIVIDDDDDDEDNKDSIKNANDKDDSDDSEDDDIIDDDENDDIDDDDDFEKSSSYSDTSKEIEILEHITPETVKISEKNNFFHYLHLNPNSNHHLTTLLKPKKSVVESHSKRWVNADLCLHKNRNVEFSSLLGRKMLEHSVKRDLMTKFGKSSGLHDSYCHTSSRTCRELRESLEYKITYKRKGRKPSWTHQYCFGKNQRKSRYKTLQTGLDENSRKLLKKCKRLHVVLMRLKLPS